MKRRIVVHLVHGTWGRGFLSVVREDLEGAMPWRILSFGGGKRPARNPFWFEPKSSFRQAVLEQIDSSISDQVEFRSFLWSGSNSLRARRFAASALQQYLSDHYRESPDAIHLLVAHSHGGVVAFKAVTQESPSVGASPLGGILTLGTPFLAFEEDSGDAELLMRALLPTALWLFLLAFLGTLVGAHFYAAALWFAAMSGGLCVALALVPVVRRPILRGAADVFLATLCVAAIWSAFSAAFPLIPVVHPAESFLGAWERAARYPFAAFASGLSAAILLVSRAAAAAQPTRGSFLLRDTVLSALSLVGASFISIATIGAVFSSNPWFEWFSVFVLFWPILSIFAARVSTADAVAFWRELEEEGGVPALPCSLDALRLPGDEASLAIVASLVAREGVNLLTAPLRGFAQLKRMPNWFLALMSLLGVAGIVTGVYQVMIFGYPGWPSYLFGPVLGLGELCGLLIFASLVFLLAIVCISVLTIALLAVAVGPEVTKLLPAMRVDCEPVPRCAASSKCRFELHWLTRDERAGLPLRHSLYELGPVQKRVAEWIVARCRDVQSREAGNSK